MASATKKKMIGISATSADSYKLLKGEYICCQVCISGTSNYCWYKKGCCGFVTCGNDALHVGRWFGKVSVARYEILASDDQALEKGGVTGTGRHFPAPASLIQRFCLKRWRQACSIGSV